MTINIRKPIQTYLHTHAHEMIEDLQTLISINSVTHNEAEAVKWLAAKMRTFDFDEIRIDPIGNVIGRVGHGPTVIMYDAHIDTIEPDVKADWVHPPLSAHIEEGFIYGRGAVDDKACVMGMTWSGRGIKELALDRDVTLWISASIMEESATGSAVDAMLNEMTDIRPDFLVIGEPSHLRIMRGQKGRAMLRITVSGKSAHASAASLGENALTKALPIIQAIDAFQGFKDESFLGKGSIEVTHIESFSPSLNTIPAKVAIYCDRRLAAGETIDDLLVEAESYCQGIDGVTVEVMEKKVTSYTGYEIQMTEYLPSWSLPEESPWVRAAADTYLNLFESAPPICKWDFCTNASSLSGIRGIPAIGFGPGEEALCHTHHERLSIDEYLKAISFYMGLPAHIGRV